MYHLSRQLRNKYKHLELRQDAVARTGVCPEIMDLYDTGSLVQMTVCQEMKGAEVQHDGRCECDVGAFGSGKTTPFLSHLMHKRPF